MISLSLRTYHVKKPQCDASSRRLRYNHRNGQLAPCPTIDFMMEFRVLQVMEHALFRKYRCSGFCFPVHRSLFFRLISRNNMRGG